MWLRFSLCFLLFSQSCFCVIPAGFSTFFRGSKCPVGWVETPGTKGRLIVSVDNSDLGGLVVGNPLANMEDRTHNHSIASSIYLDQKSISASHCCNSQGACHGQYPVTGKTASEPSNLPFVQMLLCTIVNQTEGDIPYGTLAYFANGTVRTCADNDGWATLSTATGRSLIPGYTTGLFTSTTAPLASQEDRAHTHSFKASFTTQDASYSGVRGCCDKVLAADRTYDVHDSVHSSSSNIPYVQLLTCVSQTPTFNIGLPSNAYIFTQVSCPPGYRISEVLAGRFLVSLPEKGTPGAIFGSASLPAGSIVGNNHNHPFQTNFHTNSCEVGLATGCCGSGYVKDAQYTTTGISDSSEVHFPFLSVPICEPEVGFV